MFEENIRNFNKQLEWKPEILQGSTLHVAPTTVGISSSNQLLRGNLGVDNSGQGRTLVLGMGGSHLGADLLKAYDPKLDLVVHSDYGLPVNKADLVIASSYSGNTEEVIDGLNLALEKELKVAVMASGGRLIEIAKEKSLPYIQLPTGLQPRMSAGYQVKALAKLIGREDMLEELGSLAQKLNPSEFEEKGKELAEKIGNKIPIIYSSQSNFALAYTWKIRFNETAQVPAFYNLFPEANHNEINSFSADQNFFFILLKDSQDYHRIQKRMEVFSKLFTEKSFSVEQIALTEEWRFYRLFANLLLADWTSFYLAQQNGVDPEAIPLVKEFKALIK